MTYTRINFVDLETPLNADNMNAMDEAILNNESQAIHNETTIDYHINTSYITHKYYNVSTDIHNSSTAYIATITTLDTEILTHRKQFAEIIGDVWNASAWYGTNISSLNLASTNNDTDISNLSTQTNISLPYDIGNNATDIDNLSSDVANRVFSISWNGSVTENQYLIGGPVAHSALYEFNTSVILVDTRFIMNYHNQSGNLKLTLNRSSGEIGNWSSEFANASYYSQTFSLNDTTVAKDIDGVSIQATNVSQLESLFLTLNYKENY